MKRRSRSAEIVKQRITAGLGRFIIDSLAFGAKIVLGEDMFQGK